MSSKKTEKLRVAWIITSAAAIIVLIVYFVKLNGIYKEQKENGMIGGVTEAAEDEKSDEKLRQDTAGYILQNDLPSSDGITDDTSIPDEGTWNPVDFADASDDTIKDSAAEPGQDTTGTGTEDGNTEKTGDVPPDGNNDEEEIKKPARTDDGSYVNEYGLDPSKPMVALSFDDGPSQYTEEILKVLADNNAHATFFMVGYNVDMYPEVVKAVYDSGCEIGNHTINHYNLTKQSKSTINSEINGNQEKINSCCGAELDCIVRPPYGSYDDTLKSLCQHPLILWSVDTLDWSSRNAQMVFEEVKKQTDDGCIILCHDIYESTMEAVKLYVPWLVAQGYQICSVSEMYNSRGEYQKDGHVYSHTMSAEKFLASQNEE